jgi:hypothetical protein
MFYLKTGGSGAGVSPIYGDPSWTLAEMGSTHGVSFAGVLQCNWTVGAMDVDGSGGLPTAVDASRLASAYNNDMFFVHTELVLGLNRSSTPTNTDCETTVRSTVRHGPTLNAATTLDALNFHIYYLLTNPDQNRIGAVAATLGQDFGAHLVGGEAFIVDSEVILRPTRTSSSSITQGAQYEITFSDPTGLFGDTGGFGLSAITAADGMRPLLYSGNTTTLVDQSNFMDFDPFYAPQLNPTIPRPVEVSIAEMGDVDGVVASPDIGYTPGLRIETNSSTVHCKLALGVCASLPCPGSDTYLDGTCTSFEDSRCEQRQRCTGLHEVEVRVPAATEDRICIVRAPSASPTSLPSFTNAPSANPTTVQPSPYPTPGQPTPNPISAPTISPASTEPTPAPTLSPTL